MFHIEFPGFIITTAKKLNMNILRFNLTLMLTLGHFVPIFIKEHAVNTK